MPRAQVSPALSEPSIVTWLAGTVTPVIDGTGAGAAELSLVTVTVLDTATLPARSVATARRSHARLAQPDVSTEAANGGSLELATWAQAVVPEMARSYTIDAMPDPGKPFDSPSSACAESVTAPVRGEPGLESDTVGGVLSTITPRAGTAA